MIRNFLNFAILSIATFPVSMSCCDGTMKNGQALPLTHRFGNLANAILTLSNCNEKNWVLYREKIPLTLAKAENHVRKRFEHFVTAFQSFPTSITKWGAASSSHSSFLTLTGRRVHELIREIQDRIVSRGKPSQDSKGFTFENSEPDIKSPVGYSDRKEFSGNIAIHADESNRILTKRVLDVMAKSDWADFARKEGVLVQRRESHDIPLGGFPLGVGPLAAAGSATAAPPSSAQRDNVKVRPSASGGKFLCIKATALLDAPVDRVYSLFTSNDYVLEYSEMCSECRDLGWLDRATKVSWSASKRVGPLAPRDFITRCHYRRLRDARARSPAAGGGAYLMVTMSESGLPAPTTAGSVGGAATHCRMEVHLAGYLLRGLPGDRPRTELTMISLANPGGVLDSPLGAILCNSLCATGPVQMVNALRRLAVAPTTPLRPRAAALPARAAAATSPALVAA